MDRKYSISYTTGNNEWLITRTLSLRDAFAWVIELLDGGDVEELQVIDVQLNEIVYSNPD